MGQFERTIIIVDEGSELHYMEGCTAPTYPKSPIAPGESGVIGVTYHAKGRPGGFSKNITIYTNVPDEKIKLIISGNVIPEIK